MSRIKRFRLSSRWTAYACFIMMFYVGISSAYNYVVAENLEEHAQQPQSTTAQRRG